MNIVFTPTAWEHYTEWQREDKKMVKRINELIKDIERNGLLKGIGKPEPLKHRKACSRRITEEKHESGNCMGVHGNRFYLFDDRFWRQCCIHIKK